MFILQKMAFIYNALENGWQISKNNEKYIFLKNHEGKKGSIFRYLFTTIY